MFQLQPHDDRTFLLFIDEFRHGEPQGRFLNPCTEESDSFHSMSQLILKINRCLDLSDCPQSFHTLRSFAPGEAVHPIPCEISTRRGKAANLVLRIFFRSNASWQGTITWSEQNKTQRFRSVLELIHLISSTAAQSPGFSSVYAFPMPDYPKVYEG